MQATLAILGLGVLLGLPALRLLGAVAPGLAPKIGAWHVHKGLLLGEGWLAHQVDTRSYEFVHIDDAPQELLDELGVDELTPDMLGHMDCGGRSVPFAPSYDSRALRDNPMILSVDDSEPAPVPANPTGITTTGTAEHDGEMAGPVETLRHDEIDDLEPPQSTEVEA